MTVRRIFLLSLLAVLLGVWDAAAVSWFSGFALAFRIMIPAIVACSVFGGRFSGLLVAIVGGISCDILLASNAGWMPLRYAICAYLIYELSHRIITNRSLVGSMTLGAIAICLDRIILWIVQGVILLNDRGITPEAHGPILVEILWSAFVLGWIFIVLAGFTRRFLPTISPYSGRRKMI